MDLLILCWRCVFEDGNFRKAASFILSSFCCWSLVLCCNSTSQINCILPQFLLGKCWDCFIICLFYCVFFFFFCVFFFAFLFFPLFSVCFISSFLFHLFLVLICFFANKNNIRKRKICVRFSG